MDLIKKLLNIFVPLIAVVVLLIIMPPFLIFKLLCYILKFIYNIENVKGKVVLITGASSGIGEHMAYEYARRGARLALVARREDRLRAVANNALLKGSPDVISISSDVSKVEDCKRFIDKTIQHFGELDHLVNNAGIVSVNFFEDVTELSDLTCIMDINFWGSAYATYFAIPHLRKTKGKIVVISSFLGWSPTPRTSIYNASKAALINFYETLRMELGSDIGITIVTPGIFNSEMTNGRVESELKYPIPTESSEECAKAIVKGICRGYKYLTEPSWYRVVFSFKVLCPQLLDWFLPCLFVHKPKNSKS